MRNRCLRLCAHGAFLALLASAARAALNLAPNPSFESGLTHWTAWPTDAPGATVEVSRDRARHGEACVQVRAPAGPVVLYSVPVRVSPEADYTLSAYVRTARSAGVRLSLWALDEATASKPWAPPTGDPPTDTNPLRNPGFEQGPTGWQLWHAEPSVSSGTVGVGGRNGGQAFHVLNPGTQGANLHSDPVPCEAGRLYTLGVWARVRGGKGVRIAGWARDATGKTLSYEVGGARDLPADVPEFRLFRISFGTPAGATELKAHLICNGGEVWWDDVWLTTPPAGTVDCELRSFLEVPAEQPAWARFKHIVRTPAGCAALRILLAADAGDVGWDAVQLEPGRDTTRFTVMTPAPGANRLPNSGFEGGPSGWTLWRQAADQSAGGIVAGAGCSGSAAFHVLNRGTGGANLFSDPVPATPGATLTLSASVRAHGGRGVQLAAWGVDGGGKTVSYAIGGAIPVPGDLAEFTRHRQTVVVPETVTGIRAHLICNGGEVWWDDVQLEPGAEASGYVPGPEIQVLQPAGGTAPVAYTQAIIREARLRDVLAQTERLVLYAGGDADPACRRELDTVRQQVDAVSSAIGAPYLVPDFREVDYAGFDRVAESATAGLSALWRRLGFAAGSSFGAWQPSGLPNNISQTELAREFLIFPCFTRAYHFRGEADWRVLKPFGFRVVSGWWRVGCDAAGHPRTDELDEVLRQCREQGYACDFAIDPASAAATALGAQEEFYLHNAAGGWSPHGNCHNTVSPWHPEVRRLAGVFLENLARLYAAEPTVLSYELTNEPSLTIEQHVHGYEYRADGVGDYGPHAKAAYRDWLARRYGTVDRLNTAWRTSYADFAGIEPPADLVPPEPVAGDQPVATGPLYDFQCFRAEGHADWFRHCLDAFHRGDPRKAVVSQFVSGAVERKNAAVDLRILAEDAPWDIYGTHDWPGDRPATESLYAVSMNRRARRPHWEDEFIWSQWERKGTPEPVMRAALERNLWRQIAWGKRAISLFNLESEWDHDSPGNWNNSLLNIEADLEVPRYSTGVIPTIERRADRLKQVLYDAELGPAEVAILRPTASTLVAAPDDRVRREAVAVAEFLLRQHELPLMIPEEHLTADPDALRGTRLLVAPWAIHVPAAVQAALLAWVQAGGLLVASGPFGLFDEYGAPCGQVLAASVGRGGWSYDAGKRLWACADAKPETATGTLAAACGQGRVVLAPEPFLTPPRLAVLADLYRGAIPVPRIRTTLADLEIIPRRAGNGDMLLFIINLSAREARQGELEVRGAYPKVTDLCCDAQPAVPVRSGPGVTAVPLTLPPGGAVCLRLAAAMPPN